MEEYKKVIQSSIFSIGPVIAFIWNSDATWSVEAVSKNIETIFGYKDTLFLEHTLNYAHLIHPDDLIRVTKEVKDATSEKLDSFNHKPYRVLHANGEYLWVKDSTNIVYNKERNITHFVGYIISINDELEKIEEQKTELQNIFDTTKDGIAILDLSTNFLKVNKSYCDITGLSEEELLSTSCFNLTYPDDISLSIERVEFLLESGFVESYEKRCLIGGRVITIYISMTLFPDHKHILMSIKDISKFRTFEAQAKLASMGEMIGNIAHQWRQPLSVISAMASGVEIKRELGMLDDKSILESMESILFQVNYLSTTIDDFRNFIKDTKESRTISIKETIEKTFSIIKLVLIDNHIQLIESIEDDMMIFGDQNQLIQAFINIINNAKDALNENVANDEDKIIFVETKKINDTLQIVIKDSGGGIPENVIGKVFEPYFTTKHQSIGTGIGLSMTYKILVEKHNGRIKAENIWYEYNQEHYKGACFTIEFDKDTKTTI